MLQSSHHPPLRPRGFSLIELLVVIAIIAILASIAFPAIRALTKSNDHSQAANVVRAYLSTARNIAISQQRMAGVVFFEETNGISNPVHDTQTAMQLIVEDYNQRRNGTSKPPPATADGTDFDYQISGSIPGNPRFAQDGGLTVFISYSADRQYLPRGIKVATLSGINDGTSQNITSPSSVNYPTRAIVFDAKGNLVFVRGLCTPNPGVGGIPGTYPWAYQDWKFISLNTGFDPTQASNAKAIENAISAPGFFLYSKNDYDDAVGNNVITDDASSAQWLRNHSDVIIVNSFTGSVLR